MPFHSFELENRTIVADTGSYIFFDIVRSQFKITYYLQHTFKIRRNPNNKPP